MNQPKIELFIIDRDPIFRLGLCSALSHYSDFEIAAQENTTDDIFIQLDDGFMPDLILVEWDIQVQKEEREAPIIFCQKLRQQYPQIHLFLLGANWNPEEIASVRAMGVKGFCKKGLSIETLVYGLRKVAAGNFYWQEQNLPQVEPNLLQQLLNRVSESGKQQLDLDLRLIENQLGSEGLSVLQKWFVAARRRELRSAQKLLSKLTGEYEYTPKRIKQKKSKALPQTSSELLPPPQIAIATVNTDSVTAKVFNKVLGDISKGIYNSTDLWLEIDILRPQARQKLFYLIVENLEPAIFELVKEQDILLQTEQALYEVWQKTVTSFFFQHYQDQRNIDYDTLLTICDREYLGFKETVLTYTYYASELLAYLSWEQPLFIDYVAYRADAPEAIRRAVNLLHNLIINLANGVMQVMLNYFSELEIFRYSLFDSQYNNTRKIARFRNETVWRYRQQRYWQEPTDIFESCYQLLVLRNGKIVTYKINAPRDRELATLEGLPWLATILLELRDAVSPRLRSLFALLGNALVFALTNVVGRGIGLIIKGIIQGVNSTLKDLNRR